MKKNLKQKAASGMPPVRSHGRGAASTSSTDRGATWINLGNKGNTDGIKVLIPFTEGYGLQIGSTANVSYSVPGSYHYNTATQFRTPMIVGPMPYSSVVKAYIKA